MATTSSARPVPRYERRPVLVSAGLITATVGWGSLTDSVFFVVEPWSVGDALIDGSAGAFVEVVTATGTID